LSATITTVDSREDGCDIVDSSRLGVVKDRFMTVGRWNKIYHVEMSFVRGGETKSVNRGHVLLMKQRDGTGKVGRVE
jgi:hypothetical protein